MLVRHPNAAGRSPGHREITAAIVGAVIALRSGSRHLPALPPTAKALLAHPERAADAEWLRARLGEDVGLASRAVARLGGCGLEALEQRSPRTIYLAGVAAAFDRDLVQSLPAEIATLLRERATRRMAVALEVARIAGADTLRACLDALYTDLGALVLLRLDPLLAERIAGAAAPGIDPDRADPERAHELLDRIVALTGDELVDRACARWFGLELAEWRPVPHVRQVTAIVHHHTRRVSAGDARLLGADEFAPLVRLGIGPRTFSELCEAGRPRLSRPAA